MIKQFLFLQLLFTLSTSKCQWTVEDPNIASSQIKALQQSEIICHNHIMVLFRKNIKLPFATYAIHSQEQMTNLQGGRKEFIFDPSINETDQYNPNSTIYKYPYSRGHLTPSYIMTYDKTPSGAWDETYYISNILPQTAYLNEGPWEKLEMNIVDSLSNQPKGTKWEIYTGGFWNGDDEYVLSNELNEIKKDYLFWKAFCDRKKCLSGMITAYNHKGILRWDVVPVSRLLNGLFDQCCPWNQALDDWKHLLNGVEDTHWPIN